MQDGNTGLGHFFIVEKETETTTTEDNNNKTTLMSACERFKDTRNSSLNEYKDFSSVISSRENQHRHRKRMNFLAHMCHPTVFVHTIIWSILS